MAQYIKDGGLIMALDDHVIKRCTIEKTGQGIFEIECEMPDVKVKGIQIKERFKLSFLNPDNSLYKEFQMKYIKNIDFKFTKDGVLFKFMCSLDKGSIHAR